MKILYFDGNEAQIGDKIDYCSNTAQVVDVIDSNRKLIKWGVKSFGIMLVSEDTGYTFYPTEAVITEGMILKKRK